MDAGVRRSWMAGVVLVLLTACSGVDSPASPASGTGAGAARVPAVAQGADVERAASGRGADPRPNIVLVLLDDFSMDLLPTMRSAATMLRTGASYRYSFVVDSLCCVSRASLFTGQFPHQTGVLTNHADATEPGHPMGGYAAFEAYGNADRSFAVRLQEAGYATGFVGKYLNQYRYVPGAAIPPLPPGWEEFNALFATAYDGWGFDSSYVEGGRLRVRHHPKPPAWADDEVKDRSYAGTMIQDLALDFIDRHRTDRRPWLLEVAPYAPHSRVEPVGAWPGEPDFPPAFRDRPGPRNPGGNCGRLDCAELGRDDLPGLGQVRRGNAAVRADGGTVQQWTGLPKGLRRGEAKATIRDRARMVQSVDRLLARILRTVPRNTYVVLTSDNGLHVGQHGLGVGKGAAYDSDIRVPLLLVGPRVEPGQRRQVVSNIDLAPTFEDLAGLAPAPYRSGRSLVPTFSNLRHEGENYAFVEHTWSDIMGGPDQYAYEEIDMVPSYLAVRSRTSLLVRYDLDPDPLVDDFAWEFYDYGSADFERSNGYALPRHRQEIARMTRKLVEFDSCSDVRGDDPVPGRCIDLRR